jgi:hypothetical protein
MKTSVSPMTPTRNRRSPTTHRGKVLAADACPQCGAIMLERRGTLKLPVNGEKGSVPSALHLRCQNCDEVVLRLSDVGMRSVSIARSTASSLPMTSARSLQ